jgi:hypothetical protein
MKDVEVVTATVNLLDVRNYRGSIASRGIQAAASHPVQRIYCKFNVLLFTFCTDFFVVDYFFSDHQTFSSNQIQVPHSRRGNCFRTILLVMGLSPTIWNERVFPSA